MRVFDIAIKDLYQIVRDWKAAVFLVAMPIVFTFFFGFIFNISPGDPRLPVGVIDRDGSLLSEGLLQLLAASEAIRPETLSEDDADDLDAPVASGDLAAVLVIPAGYQENLLSGQAVPLEVILEENTTAGQTVQTGVQAIVSRILSAVEIAELSVSEFESNIAFPDAASRQAFLEDALTRALAEWQQPPFTLQVEQNGSTQTTEAIASSFDQSSPGMIVQFSIIGLMAAADVIVLERRSKALMRMLTTPLRPAEVVAGHVLAMFLMVFIQQSILILFGQYLFGVNYLSVPLATLLMMVALSVWAASLGLLIGSASKTEEQVAMYAVITMMVLSALGGAWFPLDITGETFSTVGHFTPAAWAMDGFQNIIVRGQGLESVLLPAGILLAYSLVFYILAVWRFRFE